MSCCVTHIICHLHLFENAALGRLVFCLPVGCWWWVQGRGCCLMADKQLKYISFLCSFLEDPMVTCLIYSNSLLHLKEVNIVSTVKWEDWFTCGVGQVILQGISQVVVRGHDPLGGWGSRSVHISLPLPIPVSRSSPVLLSFPVVGWLVTYCGGFALVLAGMQM